MATVATIADTTIVGDNEDQLVTMIVDDQLFGIPILQVQDIVEASKITPVPLAPSAIAGVLNLRGRIVTVVDLRKLLGNHEEVPWDSQMGVTVEYKGDLYTLLVDAIGDVRTLPKHDFDKAPSTMEDNVRRLCSGIYRLRGNLLVVLDVARILHADIIGATPMLTVEERRNRKSVAVAQSDSGGGKAHQLSALMTDLNAYESETEDVFGAGADTTHEDMKARKRANRHRRPISERWRAVLEEKARKSGHTVYRMREPDEETVEIARTEMANEDAEWATRVRDSESLRAPESDETPAPDAMADAPLSDLPALDWPDTGGDAPLSDLPEQDWPDAAGDAPLSDLPEQDRPDAAGDAPAAAEHVAPTPEPLQSLLEDQPVTPAGGPNPPESDIADEEQESVAGEPQISDVAAEYHSPDQESEFQTSDTMAPDVARFDPVTQEEPPIEQPEAEAGDMPPDDGEQDQSAVNVAEVVPDTGSVEPEAIAPSPAGITGSWWNKLRAKSGATRNEPEPVETSPEEETDETPSVSEMGDVGAPEIEPEADLTAADDEPAGAEKPGGKVTKTAAKKASKAKKKHASGTKRAAKTGSKPKTSAKTRKKT